MLKLFRASSFGLIFLVLLGLSPLVSSCLDLTVDSGGSKTCGDGVVGADELCDDGNPVDADGCDSNCTPTACGNGIVTVGEACDDGNTLNTDECNSLCQLSSCGDSIPQPPEECDDGNLIGGDGCDPNCTITFCGNGAVTDGEECDDNNVVDGDGCDSNCYLTGCGSGIVTGAEECDDGNKTNGDGCDAMCKVEMVGSCGNFMIEPLEECDDGNFIQGDGCGRDCKIEHPEVCPGMRIDLNLGDLVMLAGDTTGATDKFVGSTPGVGNCMNGPWSGPDWIYALTPKVSGILNVDLTTTYANPFIHLRTQCPGMVGDEVACQYGSASGKISTSLAVNANTTYFIAADSWNNNAGKFTLTLSLK